MLYLQVSVPRQANATQGEEGINSNAIEAKLQKVDEAKEKAISVLRGKKDWLELTKTRLRDTQAALDRAVLENEQAKNDNANAEEEVRQANELASQKSSEASAIYAKTLADAQKWLDTLSAWKEKFR